MRIFKIAAQIVGILWMIFFSIAFVFVITKQSFELSTSYGAGYFLGTCIALIGITSIGHFLFKWGEREHKSLG